MNVHLRVAVKQLKQWSLSCWKEMIFVFITSGLLLWRICISAVPFDELINVSLSYRLSLGQLPFLEVREAFQTGALILAPFLKLYTLLTGTTDGIVLFSRLLYLLAMLLLAILTYRSFRTITAHKNAFYLAYLCPFFQILSLYYLWYDSLLVVFLTASSLFLYGAVVKKNRSNAFLAGILAGIMALCYPSAVIIPFVMIGVLIAVERKITQTTLFYMVGGGSFAIAAVWGCMMYVGLDQLLYGVEQVLGARSINEAAGSGLPFVNYIYQVVKAFWGINQFLILPTILLLLAFIKCIRQRKYVWILVTGVPLLAFVNNVYVVPYIRESYIGLNSFLGYIAIWAPLFYYLLPDQWKTKKRKLLLPLLWFPAVLSSVSVAMVSVPSEEYGALKGWIAFLPAAMVSLYFGYLLQKQWVNEWLPKFRKGVGKKALGTLLKANFAKLCCAGLLIGFFCYYYIDQKDVLLEHFWMRSGIYKGIAVNDWVKEYEPLQQFVQDSAEDAKTVATGGELRGIYLMGYMEPFTPTVVDFNWAAMLEYYAEFEAIPDRIYMLETSYENLAQTSPEGRQFLDSRYAISATMSWRNGTEKVVCFAAKG